MKKIFSKLKLKISIIILSIFLGLFCFAKISQAANYYVSTSGNDSNNGTSPSTPWRTLAKASASVGNGANTINVAAGTYNENITETHSGTDSTHFLHWKASGTVYSTRFTISGNYVKIEGFTLSSTVKNWWGTIHVSSIGCSILNNILTNSTQQGIVLDFDSSYCVVSGNTIDTVTLNGIQCEGSNHTITDNDISDIRVSVGGSLLTDDANGIEFHGTGHTIRGNYIHDITFENNPGRSPHIDGMQTFQNADHESATNVLIEKNHFFMMNEAQSGTATICAFMLHNFTNLTLRNNLIEARSGITTETASSGLYIYNNIFRSSLGFNSSFWPRGIEVYNITTANIYNNIFVDFSWSHIYIGGSNSGVNIDYNLYWNSNSSAPSHSGFTPNTHDKQAVDPKFVSNFTNLHYQSISPAINAGITVSSVTNDYDGISRPQGSAYDIGAYEYVGAVSDTTPPASPTVVTVQ